MTATASKLNNASSIDYRSAFTAKTLSSTAQEVLTDGDKGRWYLIPQGEPVQKVPHFPSQHLPEHYRRPIILRNFDFSDRLGGGDCMEEDTGRKRRERDQRDEEHLQWDISRPEGQDYRQ